MTTSRTPLTPSRPETSRPVRVLVIDDDAEIRLLLRRCFGADGYDVREAKDAAAAREALASERFDLITLDLQMPGENGFALAKELCATSTTPLMMVTGRTDLVDLVAGLEVGADDYITKPFHVREIQARARSILRRARACACAAAAPAPGFADGEAAAPEALRFDRWVVDLARRELATVDGQPQELTSTEFDLLRLFLHSPNRVLSRERILDLTTGGRWAPFDRSVDTQVRRLRRKIEREPSAPRLIKTVRGAGYLFAETPQRV